MPLTSLAMTSDHVESPANTHMYTYTKLHYIMTAAAADSAGDAVLMYTLDRPRCLFTSSTSIW